MQVHSVPKGLYKKIMYGISHYAVLERLPIVEKKKRLIVPHSPLRIIINYIIKIL